jgi:hypothetical protein
VLERAEANLQQLPGANLLRDQALARNAASGRQNVTPKLVAKDYVTRSSSTTP